MSLYHAAGDTFRLGVVDVTAAVSNRLIIAFPM